jgi:4-amino-4-deoxy-L-arabinose transferase-like glycosyltransferase
VTGEEETFKVELRAVEGMWVQQVRDSARLRVHDDQDGEGDEIEQIPPRAPQDERRHEQHDEVAVRRQAEAEELRRHGEGAEERERREDRRPAIEVGARWAPALGVLAAVGLAIAVRLPFLNAPLTSDEGGYAEVARLWERSNTLYRGAWVDRPQGLMLIYRGISDLGLGSTEGLRAAAAAVAVLTLLATMLVALRLGGRITALSAAVLVATAGSSPFIESFTLSGELLSSVPALLSLLAFCAYLRRGRSAWLVLAGLLTGCALMIRQSAFDVGLAAIALLVVRERRRAWRSISLLLAGAAAPVAAGAMSAAQVGAWWYAVVAYRGDGDSLFTGSPIHRYHLLMASLPAAAKALAPLAALAALGWWRAPLLLRLWLGAAVVGVLAGGNFHAHYYLQLVPPLAVLGGIAVSALVEERRQIAWGACAAAAAAALAFAAPLWFASGVAQAEAIWPRDPHLRSDAAVSQYVRTHTRPHEHIFVVWAAADVYYLADRPPAFKYIWYRNVQAIPGALPAADRMLAQRKPALVVAAQTPLAIDRSSLTTMRILRREYRLVAAVAGVPIYRRLEHTRPGMMPGQVP